jgi:hypothetical protein
MRMILASIALTMPAVASAEPVALNCPANDGTKWLISLDEERGKATYGSADHPVERPAVFTPEMVTIESFRDQIASIIMRINRVTLEKEVITTIGSSPPTVQRSTCVLYEVSTRRF